MSRSIVILPFTIGAMVICLFSVAGPLEIVIFSDSMIQGEINVFTKSHSHEKERCFLKDNFYAKSLG